MSIFPSKVADATTPASVFAAHYDFLLDWALRFTHGNRTVAEDLVQETFVTFVTSREEVKNPEDARPLLWKYLNYVHGAEIRKSQRHPLQNMTTIEFDSLQMSLRERVATDSIDLQDELRNIMSYLCWRKESLKPASILLLRFFYGYSHSEITKICLMSRQSVDHGLSTAREEVRHHIRSTGRLSVVRADGPPPPTSKHFALQVDQFMEELAADLAHAKSTPCLPRQKLLRHYSAKSPKALTCSLLAHLVSCTQCLEAVHRYCEFPDITDQSSKKLVEMNNRPTSGRGKKKDVGTAKVDIGHMLNVASQRSRELREHRPKSLTIIVNGEAVATQEVRSSTNTQRVEWKPEKNLDFIEVESEQGVSLLIMPIHALPPDCPPAITRDLELNDGRSIHLVLSFLGSVFSIEVTYNDPFYFATATPEAQALYESELFSDGATVEGGSMCGPSDEQLVDVSTTLAHEPRQLRDIFRWIKMPEFNPIFSTALVFAVASLFCFFIWTKWRPVPITANELLVRAESWDASSQRNGQSGVVRQEVSISTGGGIVRRTIYRDTHGIRRPRKEKNAVPTEQLKTRLATAGVDWNEPLSATSYQDWHDHQHVRRDQIDRSGKKLLTLTTTTPDGPVSQESITIREADFHPVERTIKFRDSGTVQIAELDYEVMPWSKADPNWFDPLTPTLPGANSPHSSLLNSIPKLLTDTQLDIAELETRLVLNRLSDDEKGRIEFARSASGIEVTGIIATSDRKLEIERDLRKIPHVTPKIYTFAEMENLPQGEGQPTKLSAATIVEAASPLQLFLLAKKWTRDEIGSLAQELFIRSASIERESRSLNDLQVRFKEPDKLDEQARAALEVLLSEHRAVLRKDIAAEQGILQRIGGSLTAAGVHDSTNLQTGDLVALAKTNRTLCNELLAGDAEQSKGADVIISSISASLSQIGDEVVQNDVRIERQANSSASLPISHGKQ